MSTRATIVCDNFQHHHFELCTKHNYNIKSEDDWSIVLEFSKDVLIEDDYGKQIKLDGFSVVIPKGTEDYNLFTELLRKGA